MKLITTLWIVGLLVVSTMALAQAASSTNSPALPAGHEVIQVDSAETAFAAWLHYLGFSKEDAALALVMLHLAARYVRNTALKNVTSDRAGTISKLTALAAGKPLEQKIIGAVAAAGKPDAG